MRRTAALFLGVALVVGAAGCGDDDPSADGSGSPTTTTAESGDVTATTGAFADDAVATVRLADSSLGQILADGDGATLYLFTPDTGTTSTCTGDCADTWPPLAGPATGDGIESGELGTTTRDDGSVQTTYHGHPLYTFAGDSAPGDVTGQGTGGKWFVVDGSGVAVKNDDNAAESATTVTSKGYGY